jgi:signal transduction histidine kinase
VQTVKPLAETDVHACAQARATQPEVQAKLLAHVGHEIKNPLNAVLGFAQLMALDTRDPLEEFHRPQVQAIGELARHMLRIVNDMIEMGRADACRPAAKDKDVAVTLM